MERVTVSDGAIEIERRRRFFQEANESYARLRSDPEAWREWQEEMRPWERLPDGLPADEPQP